MRIAQITDLHMRHHQPGSSAENIRRSRLMPQLFEQALNAARELQVDLVAVTGDLLDVPDWICHPLQGFEYDDVEPWRSAAIEDYRLLKKILDASKLRYMVLPGNHDNEEAMWQVFDPTENIVEIADHRVVRFCDREAEWNMPRRFTTERTRWEEMLADRDGLPQIHLQHYMVTPTLNEGWPHTYAEGENLAERTNDSGKVRLSLSGHYHEGTEVIQQSSTAFATGPAFTISPFAWRVYDITDNNIAMTEHQLGRDAEPRQRCVFLDRDGVINDLASYRTGAEKMNLIAGAGEAIARLRKAGYAVVVITNQSAVGYGYVPSSVVHGVNDKMCRQLADEGGEVDGLYYLTSGGQHSIFPQERTKSTSKTVSMQRATEELNLDVQGAWMVGDRVTDIQAALKASDVTPILVRTGSGESSEADCLAIAPDVHVAEDLSGAANYILEQS